MDRSWIWSIQDNSGSYGTREHCAVIQFILLGTLAFSQLSYDNGKIATTRRTDAD